MPSQAPAPINAPRGGQTNAVPNLGLGGGMKLILDGAQRTNDQSSQPVPSQQSMGFPTQQSTKIPSLRLGDVC